MEEFEGEEKNSDWDKGEERIYGMLKIGLPFHVINLLGSFLINLIVF